MAQRDKAPRSVLIANLLDGSNGFLYRHIRLPGVYMQGIYRRQERIADFNRLNKKELEIYGGEGGIRTPDSLTTMPDFESGAFNRALPPLRGQRHFENGPFDKQAGGPAHMRGHP